MKEDKLLREREIPIYRYDTGKRNYEYEICVFIDKEEVKKFRSNGKNVEDAIYEQTGYRVRLSRTNKDNDYDLAVFRLDNTKLSNRKPLYYVIESAWQSRGYGISRGYGRKVYVDWQTGKPID